MFSQPRLNWKVLPLGPGGGEDSAGGDSKTQKEAESKYAAIVPADGCATLKLDCTKDVAFCVGIDSFSKDAEDMRDVFTDLGLNADKVEISTSKAGSDCTKSGTDINVL